MRKKAQAVVPLMMQHVGWDAMSKQANKLKVSLRATNHILIHTSVKHWPGLEIATDTSTTFNLATKNSSLVATLATMFP